VLCLAIDENTVVWRTRDIDGTVINQNLIGYGAGFMCLSFAYSNGRALQQWSSKSLAYKSIFLRQ